jgi:hypothetical protein
VYGLAVTDQTSPGASGWTGHGGPDKASLKAATTEVQITPVQINPAPDGIDARDALLRAIAQEAQHVGDKLPGQTAHALADLAQAYAW